MSLRNLAPACFSSLTSYHAPHYCSQTKLFSLPKFIMLLPTMKALHMLFHLPEMFYPLLFT